MGVVRMNGRGFIAGAAMSLALAGGATPLSSAEIQHRTEYAIRLSGLPVATASFQSQFSGNRFSISGSLHSAGLADIFARTKGNPFFVRSFLAALHADGLIQRNAAGWDIDLGRVSQRSVTDNVVGLLSLQPGVSRCRLSSTTRAGWRPL